MSALFEHSPSFLITARRALFIIEYVRRGKYSQLWRRRDSPRNFRGSGPNWTAALNDLIAAGQKWRIGNVTIISRAALCESSAYDNEARQSAIMVSASSCTSGRSDLAGEKERFSFCYGKTEVSRIPRNWVSPRSYDRQVLQ